MAFINNTKFKEIKEAAKNGNETAKQIVQALMKSSSQGDLDRLVNEYYKVDTVEEELPPVVEEEIAVSDNIVEEPEIEPVTEEVFPEVVDITDLLNGELEGLIDENEIEEMSFGNFLENKKRDGLRSRKNNEYFKAFDTDGKLNYLNNKRNEYSNKFGDMLHDIDRYHQDLDISLGKYTDSVNTMLDDNVNLDMNVAGNAYEDIIGNNGIMHSIGRHWDEVDTNHVIEDLKLLVSKYGKANILAALNTLKSDNNNFRDYRKNQIDSEIGRYGKSLENLLK